MNAQIKPNERTFSTDGDYKIADISLADYGRKEIDIAEELRLLRSKGANNIALASAVLSDENLSNARIIVEVGQPTWKRHGQLAQGSHTAKDGAAWRAAMASGKGLEELLDIANVLSDTRAFGQHWESNSRRRGPRTTCRSNRTRAKSFSVSIYICRRSEGGH